MRSSHRIRRAVAPALLALVSGCSSVAPPAVAEPTASLAACPPREAATDPRVVALLGNASASLARGDHGAALALLRAAATLGPSPLDDGSTRAALASLPLPVAVTPATTAHERSADGTTLAYIAQPSALQADSDVGSLCEHSPLEWVDLARGTRGSLPLTAIAGGDRLAPLLALDAEAAQRRQLVTVLRDRRGCAPSVDACEAEPQPPEQSEVEGGAAVPALLPRHELCGRVEGLSAHGTFAVVALPDVQVGRVGTGICVLPSRLGYLSDPQQAVCVGTRYQVIALADSRVALDAAADTEAIRIAEDERHAYVRTRDGARVVSLVPGLDDATLAADCRGPVSFSSDGGSLVAVCGSRIDVVSLGGSVATRSLPLDVRGLGALREQPILAVATNGTDDRFALVFPPTPWPNAHHRWALLDARGRVAYRVDDDDLAPEVEATPVEPLYERAAAVPVVRGSSAGIGCGDPDRAYHGQTLWQPARVGARFEDETVVLFGRQGATIPAEFWRLRAGPRRRGDLSRMRLLRRSRVFGPGEWLTSVPATPTSEQRLVFAQGVYDVRGEPLGPAHPDHAVGPSRWDDPSPDEAPPPTDLETFLADTGARSNLRVCPDDLRVVAVLPMPPPDTVWADAESCARPAPTSPEEDGQCRGGLL